MEVHTLTRKRVITTCDEVGYYYVQLPTTTEVTGAYRLLITGKLPPSERTIYPSNVCVIVGGVVEAREFFFDIPVELPASMALPSLLESIIDKKPHIPLSHWHLKTSRHGCRLPGK
jgi:hypothetical protein